MIQKLAHIGVAVKDIEAVEKFYQETLSLEIGPKEHRGDIKATFIPVGDTAIELLQSTHPDGVLAKFIEKRGEGIHHIAFQVDDIEKALENLKAKGLNLIDEKPRRGAHNTRIAFINPKGTYGILLELVEPEKNS